MHVAVLRKDKCHPKKCNHECQYFCPPVRNNIPTIDFIEGQDEPLITEKLCIGCGICVKRCPFGAITIVNVPDELNKEIVHQFSENSFRLYSLPTLSKGKVISILGKNGLGKTTALNILSGVTVPNFGRYDDSEDRDAVLERYSGTMMGRYFKDLYDGKNRVVIKSQYVDRIPKVAKGKVKHLLSGVDEMGIMDDLVEKFSLTNALDRDITNCSGGELQKIAVASTLMKKADTYMFDEISSYLDIGERIRVATAIQELAKGKLVMVVEHDLAILDWLADEVAPVYGQPGAYGVITKQRAANRAINSFLSGYLREENVRMRDYEIEFSRRSTKRAISTAMVTSWEEMTKDLGAFRLDVNPGKLYRGEIVGCLGRNALGKTTFMKMLAGEIQPDSGDVTEKVKISYKPQYISSGFEGTVRELFMHGLREKMTDTFTKAEIMHPLNIEDIFDSPVQELSGGELQRASIALSLAADADLYLLDEPSAHLDSEYRMAVGKVLRRVMENSAKPCVVIDHDVYFIDLISDRLMVFRGEQGLHGESIGPMQMREGMNIFLEELGITFRRDEKTERPRINKLGSSMDRSQKETGEYYYS
ncbi:MAG: ribosome biogenesis/translation initiation ATPase RLI [Candidatus Thermoplasmatota archaeon]|nr:ribosome biogenesis/translation initiation ATPase RLI [Candidatus Thermoplasmatota archaeon]MCL5437709.1 ribosome biogenesis/translation initiation ATPase RLI [Candidatus Thermoplasmatota archaeon]